MIQLEIIDELLREETHIRGLAKKLKTNPMKVLRTLRELSKENVLDYKPKGRNNLYFLKKTSEAKAFVFMAENYKLIRFIKKHPEIRSVVENIQKENKIKLAILFGSYAKGYSKEDSDIDVYIETNDSKLKKSLELLNSKLSIKIGEFDLKSLLIREIIKDHIIIKGIEEFYEKNGFFE